MADHWPPEQRERAVNALAELLLWKLAKNRAAITAATNNAPVPANDTTPPRAAVGSRRKR